MTDEINSAPAKGPKKPERPEATPEVESPVSLLSFDEFVQIEALPVVRAEGLRVHLRATAGLASRPQIEWRAALNHYQAMA